MSGTLHLGTDTKPHIRYPGQPGQRHGERRGGGAAGEDVGEVQSGAAPQQRHVSEAEVQPLWPLRPGTGPPAVQPRLRPPPEEDKALPGDSHCPRHPPARPQLQARPRPLRASHGSPLGRQE